MKHMNCVKGDEKHMAQISLMANYHFWFWRNIKIKKNIMIIKTIRMHNTVETLTYELKAIQKNAA